MQSRQVNFGNLLLLCFFKHGKWWHGIQRMQLLHPLYFFWQFESIHFVSSYLYCWCSKAYLMNDRKGLCNLNIKVILWEAYIKVIFHGKSDRNALYKNFTRGNAVFVYCIEYPYNVKRIRFCFCILEIIKD